MELLVIGFLVLLVCSSLLSRIDRDEAEDKRQWFDEKWGDSDDKGEYN